MSRVKPPLKPSEKREVAKAVQRAKAREKASRPPGRGSPLTPLFEMAARGPLSGADGMPSPRLAYVLARYSATQSEEALQLKAAIVSDAFADLAGPPPKRAMPALGLRFGMAASLDWPQPWLFALFRPVLYASR